MRAMAILYIGPQRNPDFQTDYYISPILSPPHLLADFPPVYLICGEKDPFVDDTVIFAGKIREAKRSRRATAELASQGKSAKYGESLRMSSSSSKSKSSDSGAGAGQSCDAVDPILDEMEEDWVQMRIIEGWGHGFMQMSSLMKEVDPVLREMADWIDESFERAEMQQQFQAEAAARRQAALLPPDIVLPTTTHLKPVRNYAKTPSDRELGGADLGSQIGFNTALEQDEDGVLSFTPKNKKRTPPPSRFHPIPRRPSKDMDLHRSDSAPRFDVDESALESTDVRTSPSVSYSVPTNPPKGSATFAFFGGRSTASPRPIPPTIVAPQGGLLYGSSLSSRRASGGGQSNNASATSSHLPTNSLVAAAVAGARAATPALAAAGLVPQSVGSVTEAELMRRRRMEAVFGMGETDSAVHSEGEDED
jgi:hypothetical protein